MIILVLLSLVLLGIAVALVARGVMVSRFRTVDTLEQIGYYGFAGTIELEPQTGFRGFFDSAASGIGVLLTEHLNIVNEERLRKNLVAAGMYQTTTREIIGYSLLFALGLPALGVWLLVAAGASATLTLIAAIFLAAIGWVGPGFLVQQRAEGRLYRIDRAMPELIDLLVVTVEAGPQPQRRAPARGRPDDGPARRRAPDRAPGAAHGPHSGAGAREHGRPLPDAGGRVLQPAP